MEFNNMKTKLAIQLEYVRNYRSKVFYWKSYKI